MAKVLSYGKDIILNILSWTTLLFVVWIYNLTSLTIPNFFLAIIADLAMIGAIIVLLGWTRDDARKIVIRQAPIYSFFISLTFGLLATPVISNALNITDESLLGFLILGGLVSGCQLYLEALLENSQSWYFRLSKGYAWIISAGLIVLVLNYRLKVYLDIVLLNGYDHLSKRIMLDSFIWIFENV